MHQEHPEHIGEGQSFYTLFNGHKVRVVKKRHDNIVAYKYGEDEENVECYKKLRDLIMNESDPHRTSSFAYPSKDFMFAVNLGDLNSLPIVAMATIIGVTKFIVEEILEIEYGKVVPADCGCIIISGQSRDEL